MKEFYDTESFWVLHHAIEGYAKPDINTTNKISYALKFESLTEAINYKENHNLDMFNERHITANYHY